eukprot:ANDGO_05719.mRNA.1 hypothetical protein
MGDFSQRIPRHVVSDGMISNSESESESGFDSTGNSYAIRIRRTASPKPTDRESNRIGSPPHIRSAESLSGTVDSAGEQQNRDPLSERIIRKRRRRYHKEAMRLRGNVRTARMKPVPLFQDDLKSDATSADSDDEQLVQTVPFRSIFGMAFQNPDFVAFWEPFSKLSETEQREFFVKKDRKKNADGNGCTAVDRMRNVPRTLRSFVKTYGTDSAFLRRLEQQYEEHFHKQNALLDPLVIYTANSWQRCFIHASAAYYGLSSQSCDVGDQRLTFVTLKAGNVFQTVSQKLTDYLKKEPLQDRKFA